ncbi:arsenic resistance protein [Comamonas sp. Y6]|uniref:Arsenic resistance protein n=1 Tax=Comamonas resistens TaxID=3046670 RepID=A0ABY8SZ29_9BURK|nr:bile acid:sodium symporter [Comamonas resistens]MDL5035718.1 arsenic resistance protein [Comamonas resistens]WHS68025.1 arsenic resistance protein [Comamonas resistens]HBP0979080.1 arsenic resistance protein [Pseudomonas aeruginosa]
MENIRATLEARQVWIYFLAIACGALLGLTVPGMGTLEAAINPALAVMLFATFLQVPLAEIGAALRNVRFLGALAVTNFVIIPIVAAALVQFLPAEPMLRLAVLFVLLAPCIDYVITFTHLGGGNARLLLAMTPVLLVLQMLLLPVYLTLVLGSEVSNLVEVGPFLHAFIWLIAVPLLLAASFQALGRKTSAGERLVDVLNLLPVPATAIVLFIVLASVMPQIGLAQEAALRAAPIYVAFALIAPLAGRLVTRSLGLDAASARAVSFSASYRNSLVILPLAFVVPGGVPLLPAVILTQTIVELCFMPIYVRWIPLLAKAETGASAA